MKISRSIRIALGIGALAGYIGTASAAIVISEVDPYGSNSSDGYAEDWFELTNTGSSAVSIAGWSMLDNHAASDTTSPYSAGSTISIGNLSAGNATFGAALLTLANGQTTLAAGQTAIFLESSSNAAAAASTTIISNFEKTWFGANVPAGLTVGTFDDGTNYGLSQTADMVNIFSGSSASSALLASVAFGDDATGTPMATFDNTAGLNNATLTTKSVAGVNGAFVSATGGLEVGSPGVDAAPVPLPASLWLLAAGMTGLSTLFRKRKIVGVKPA